MSASLRSPQISRIARLLGVEPDDVRGLDDVPDADLRALHDLIGRSLFADGRHRFARVANLSNLLPGTVAGKLAERFLPPTLAARVAELLEPPKARELVTKVSVSYLAHLALVLDPTNSKPVVQAIPAPRVAEVARALFDREEYAAMAEFAGTVTLEALFAALEVATARDLLEVVPLLTWNDNIDKVVDDIPPQKMDAILSEIVAADLWDQAAYLIEHLHPPALGAVARGLFDRGEYQAMAGFADLVSKEAMAAVLDVANARDLIAVVPLLTWNDTIDELIAVVPAEKIDAIVHEIVDADLHHEAAYLIEHLHPPALGAVARGLFDRGEYQAMAGFADLVSKDAMAAVLEVATARDLLEVVPLLTWNDTIDALVSDVPGEKIDAILREVAEHDLWAQGEYLIEHLGTPELIDKALTRVDAVGDDVFDALSAAAGAGKLGPTARDLLAKATAARAT